MHRFVCLMALSLFGGLSHAGMSLSNAEICQYQHVNAEQIFDRLQGGEAPEQIRDLLYAANLDLQKDPQLAALSVDMPMVFLKKNQSLSRPAAVELVYLLCDAGTKRQHSPALLEYLHTAGERCQVEHQNDKKKDRKISNCMRQAYESFDPATAAAADLETAKKYLSDAQAGNAEAMYQLGVLLLTRGPDPMIATPEQIEAWKPIGNRFTASRWIEQSAEAGHKPAITTLCESGKDPLAPAARREAAQRWCEKL